MNSRPLPLLISITATLLFTTAALPQEPAKKTAKSKPQKAEPKPVIQAEARRQAELLHEVYSSTLQIMHRRYFRPDQKTTVPSKALDDVFYRVSLRSKVKARWIAVNARAMSIDHTPKDAFEKQAARRFVAGDSSHETVENGLYRRAGRITLFGSCINCHAHAPMNQNVRRYAGLVISIPVKPGTRARKQPVVPARLRSSAPLK